MAGNRTGMKHSAETKEKISATLKEKGHRKGTKHSAETKAKMSATLKAKYAAGWTRTPPMLGKKHSDETKRKMSESHKKVK